MRWSTATASAYERRQRRLYGLISLLWVAAVFGLLLRDQGVLVAIGGGSVGVVGGVLLVPLSRWSGPSDDDRASAGRLILTGVVLTIPLLGLGALLGRLGLQDSNAVVGRASGLALGVWTFLDAPTRAQMRRKRFEQLHGERGKETALPR